MSTSPPLFTLNDLVYKDICHIEHLTIQADCVTCIVGVSGSGKTTVLRLLNKMIQPNRGQILYRDQDLNAINSVAHRRTVVMLPQEPVMFSGTIADNLQVGRVLSERSTVTEEILLRRLKDVHLDLSLTQTTEHLSGGEKQRIALTRVMLMEPDVLLLDEPSSALDPQTEETIFQSVVADRKRRGSSVVMVTHSAKAATQWADRIITMSDGRVVSDEEVTR